MRPSPRLGTTIHVASYPQAGHCMTNLGFAKADEDVSRCPAIAALGLDT